MRGALSKNFERVLPNPEEKQGFQWIPRLRVEGRGRHRRGRQDAVDIERVEQRKQALH